MHVPLEVNIRFSVNTDNELHPFVNKTNLKKDQEDLKASFKIFASSLHLISINLRIIQKLKTKTSFRTLTLYQLGGGGGGRCECPHPIFLVL